MGNGLGLIVPANLGLEQINCRSTMLGCSNTLSSSSFNHLCYFLFKAAAESRYWQFGYVLWLDVLNDRAISARYHQRHAIAA